MNRSVLCLSLNAIPDCSEPPAYSPLSGFRTLRAQLFDPKALTRKSRCKKIWPVILVLNRVTWINLMALLSFGCLPDFIDFLRSAIESKTNFLYRTLHRRSPTIEPCLDFRGQAGTVFGTNVATRFSVRLPSTCPCSLCMRFTRRRMRAAADRFVLRTPCKIELQLSD